MSRQEQTDKSLLQRLEARFTVLFASDPDIHHKILNSFNTLLDDCVDCYRVKTEKIKNIFEQNLTKQ